MPAAVARQRHTDSATEDFRGASHHRSGQGAVHQHGSRHKSYVATRPVRHRPLNAPPLSMSVAGTATLASPALAYGDVVHEELPDTGRAARRRSRRAHRPLEWSWPLGVGVTVLLAQLVALLWLQGLALSARNRSYALDKSIAQAQEGVSRTQKEIAALDSSPQIAQWARARGWSVATQDRLDPLTKSEPLVTKESEVP